MSYCSKCGMKLDDGGRFCTGCGTPVPSPVATEASPPQTERIETRIGERQAPLPLYEAPVQTQPTSLYMASAASVQGEVQPPAGSRYTPVSTGGFIGIFLLMLIPIVNLILLIVWACGGCKKVNQVNLARAMLVLLLIGAALMALVVFVGGLFFNSLGGLGELRNSLIEQVMESAAE